jgi:hypothetical protein
MLDPSTQILLMTLAVVAAFAVGLRLDEWLERREERPWPRALPVAYVIANRKARGRGIPAPDSHSAPQVPTYAALPCHPARTLRRQGCAVASPRHLRRMPARCPSLGGRGMVGSVAVSAGYVEYYS